MQTTEMKFTFEKGMDTQNLVDILIEKKSWNATNRFGTGNTLI